MLDKFISQLIQDLELGDVNLASGMPGAYSLPIDEEVSVLFTESPEGINLKSVLAPVPKGQEEHLFTRAMLGNLFNQGTRGAVIGLTPDGQKLSLSLLVEPSVDYRDFRDLLEDFMNAVELWKEEIKSFEPEAAGKKR